MSSTPENAANIVAYDIPRLQVADGDYGEVTRV